MVKCKRKKTHYNCNINGINIKVDPKLVINDTIETLDYAWGTIIPKSQISEDFLYYVTKYAAVLIKDKELINIEDKYSFDYCGREIKIITHKDGRVTIREGLPKDLIDLWV